MDSRGCLRLKYLICILSSPSGALMKFRRKGFLCFAKFSPQQYSCILRTLSKSLQHHISRSPSVLDSPHMTVYADADAGALANARSAAGADAIILGSGRRPCGLPPDALLPPVSLRSTPCCGGMLCCACGGICGAKAAAGGEAGTICGVCGCDSLPPGRESCSHSDEIAVTHRAKA